MIDCTICDGTGNICAVCGNIEDACICEDGVEIDDCPECGGSGKIAVEGEDDTLVDKAEDDDDSDV